MILAISVMMELCSAVVVVEKEVGGNVTLVMEEVKLRGNKI
jgi:hypothetical protein